MPLQTFMLTEADVKLLDFVENSIRLKANLFPLSQEDVNTSLMLYFNVIGEKHKFKANTIQKHPEGEPKILAEPL